MKAMVRDDIIALKSFVAAEFKYKKYLEDIKKAGSYCFLDQFKKIIPGAVTILNGMSEHNLISTMNINKNYKYIYLTDTALKYLNLKDSDEDFSNIKKNKISSTKASNEPSEKQLFSSAYKFHLLSNNEDMIDKESILNALEDNIYLQEFGATKENFINYTTERMKVINEKQEQLENVISKLKFLTTAISDINQEIFDISSEDQEIRRLKSKRIELESEIKRRKNEKKLIKSSTGELEAQLEQIEFSINEVSKILELKKKTITKYNNFVKANNSRNTKNDTILKNAENEITKALKKEQDVVIPRVINTKSVFANLYDISKIIARIKDNTLEFIILDYGNFKTAGKYLKLINKIEALRLNYEKLKIIIYSYGDHRAENLTKEFLSYDKKKANALKSLRTYNARLEEFEDSDEGYRPTFFVKTNEVYDSIPRFELEVRRDFYYMSDYKGFVTRGEKSIKNKDKKAINDIIEKLKNN